MTDDANGQRQGTSTLPVQGGRVACPLLGEVELERCVECDQLIRVEWAAGTTAHGVLCGWSGDADNLSW